MATKIKKRAKHRPPSLSASQMDALRLVYEGARLCGEGDASNAEDTWRQAAKIDPECAPAWKYLTDFLAVHQRTDEALSCLSRLASISQRTAENLFELADKSSFLKQYGQARVFLKEALAMRPSSKLLVECLVLLAKIEFTEDQWESAIDHATQVLTSEPENLEALAIRQRCYFLLAWMEEDVNDCRRYLEIQPDSDRHSRLLFKLTYLMNVTLEQVYEESVRWNQLYAAPLASQILPHRNSPHPERRLKIGYVSPDIRNHAVMKLLPPVLERCDKENFELFIYSIDTQRDQVTDYVERVVENFVELPGSKDAIATRVREDQIDILVDIAGHTMHVDAYLAFALKPAPVQVSWMGVLQTSGLNTMDYFIGDQYTPRPGTEHLFSETVYRLTSPISCYRPTAVPPIAASPCLANGHITFGSFNDPRKITRDLVKMWSVILHLHPKSRLLLKYGNLEKEPGQRRLRSWFYEDGIAPERLVFEGRSKPLEYLASWNKVDIALDSYPYHGGTTTMDAFWMGVPVVTLAGRMPVSCGGVGLLTAVSLPVAQTAEQYIALANLLAKTIPTRPDLRQRLRDLMLTSPLMDEKGMVRSLENAYRDMWRKWCDTQKTR